MELPRREVLRRRPAGGGEAGGTRFIGSYTSLRREGGEDGQYGRILRELGIDPATFVAVPARPEEEADHIFILRYTLMNPFLMDGPGGRSYIDMYWDFLEEAIDAALVE